MILFRRTVPRSITLCASDMIASAIEGVTYHWVSAARAAGSTCASLAESSCVPAVRRSTINWYCSMSEFAGISVQLSEQVQAAALFRVVGVGDLAQGRGDESHLLLTLTASVDHLVHHVAIRRDDELEDARLEA